MTDQTISWLRDLAAKGGKGVVNNIDARSLGRVADELERLSRPAQRKPDPAAQFVMWSLMNGSWQGCDIDGGAAQDKAVELGLIIEDQYDPKRHGENSYCEPGDRWFIPSEALLSALSSTTCPDWYCEHGRQGGCSCKDSCKGFGPTVTSTSGQAAEKTEGGAA